MSWFSRDRRAKPKKHNNLRLRSLRPKLEMLEQRQLPSVSFNSFPGLNPLDPGSRNAALADIGVAAGPNYVVETATGSLRIMNKTTHNATVQALNSFFHSANTVDDPVVGYDELRQRFVVGVIDYPSSPFPFSGGFTQPTGGALFDLAVSASSDPTGPWTIRRYHMDDGTAGANHFIFSDFPRLGWTAGDYVVTFDMYRCGGGQASVFAHVDALIIDKTTLNSGLQIVPGDTGSMPGLTPAVVHDTGGMVLVQARGARWSNGFIIGSTIRLVQMGIQSNRASLSASFVNFDITVPHYDDPPAASQAGSLSGDISTGWPSPGRILNVARRGNRLVASQTVGVGGGLLDPDPAVAHARWYEFTMGPGSPTLRQSGEITSGDPNATGALVNTYLPSIEIAANGDLGMTFVESTSAGSPDFNGGEFMSMWITGRKETDALGVMEAAQLVAKGTDFWQSGVLNVSDPLNPISLTGWYSGISVDPSIPNGFWAANEFAIKPFQGALGNNLPNNWDSRIVSFHVINPTLATSYGLAAVTTTGRQYTNAVFAVGADGNLYVNHMDAVSQLDPGGVETWEWDALPPAKVPFGSGPAAVYSNNTLYVFIEGNDGNLYIAEHTIWPFNSNWTWLDLTNPNPNLAAGVRLSGQPSAVVDAAGIVSVFVNGVDRHGTTSLFLLQDAGNILAWQSLPPIPGGVAPLFAPTASVDPYRVFGTNVYVTGSDNRMHILHSDPNANVFNWLAGPSLVRPGGSAAAAYAPSPLGMRLTFVVDAGVLRVDQIDANNNDTLLIRAGFPLVTLSGTPTAQYMLDGTVDVTVLGTGVLGTQSLFVFHFNPSTQVGTWTNLAPGFAMATQPVSLEFGWGNSVAGGPAEDVFVIGTDGRLHRDHRSSSGFWSAWVSQN
jgi:hypothetical protein